MNSYNAKHVGDRPVKKITILLCNLVLFYIFIYSLLAFYHLVPLLNNYNVTLFSIIAVIVTLFVFLNTGSKHGLSTALLLYTIATQFGMSTVYYLLGPQYLDTFSATTLRFLTSTQYE